MNGPLNLHQYAEKHEWNGTKFKKDDWLASGRIAAITTTKALTAPQERCDWCDGILHG